MGAEPRGSGVGRTLALLAAAAVLVAVFSLLLFPWERLAPTAAQQLSAATGARVSLGHVDLGIGLGGPEVEAEAVTLEWPGARLELDRLRVRPAWSLSWLWGDPALYVDAAGPPGAIEGTATVSGGFDGTIEGLDLTQLPPAWLPGGEAPLAGAIDGTIALAPGPAGPVGEVALDGRDGAVALATLPVAIPYDTLEGRFAADESGLLRVETLTLQGPMLSLDVTGTVQGIARLAQAPLDLQIKLRDIDPAFQSSLAAFGMRLDPSGSTDLAVTGTPSRPVIR